MTRKLPRTFDMWAAEYFEYILPFDIRDSVDTEELGYDDLLNAWMDGRNASLEEIQYEAQIANLRARIEDQQRQWDLTCLDWHFQLEEKDKKIKELEDQLKSSDDENIRKDRQIDELEGKVDMAADELSEAQNEVFELEKREIDLQRRMTNCPNCANLNLFPCCKLGEVCKWFKGADHL